MPSPPRRTTLRPRSMSFWLPLLLTASTLTIVDASQQGSDVKAQMWSEGP